MKWLSYKYLFIVHRRRSNYVQIVVNVTSKMNKCLPAEKKII